MAFNETLFLASGGSACVARDALFDNPRYTHDPSLSNCSLAFETYRNVTSPSFTCDCKGDFAALGGGLRAGTVFILSNAIATAIIVFIAPLVGTWLDFHGGKCLWWALMITAGICMCGQAILAPNYIWLIGLIIQVVTVVTSETVTIPRLAYLEDIHPRTPDEPHTVAAAVVAGHRTIAAYASQLTFVIFALIVSAFTSDAVVVSIIVTLTCGVWYLSMYSYAISKFPSRPPTRTSKTGSLVDIAFRQQW